MQRVRIVNDKMKQKDKLSPICTFLQGVWNLSLSKEEDRTIFDILYRRLSKDISNMCIFRMNVSKCTELNIVLCFRREIFISNRSFRVSRRNTKLTSLIPLFFKKKSALGLDYKILFVKCYRLLLNKKKGTFLRQFFFFNQIFDF